MYKNFPKFRYQISGSLCGVPHTFVDTQQESKSGLTLYLKYLRAGYRNLIIKPLS